MTDTTLICRDDHRRATLRDKNTKRPAGDAAGNDTFLWNGIDHIEFDPRDEYPIHVYFLCAPSSPPQPNRFEVYDEQTRTRIQKFQVCPKSCNPARLKADPPLFSNATYVLSLRQENFDSSKERIDPHFVQRRFTTTSDTTDLDPAPPAECPARALDEPKPNYLARDYASFRQLLFDRLRLIMPGWSEKHVPDIGVTLVEMFSYVGDYLAYYQDAVATEAYLNTARQRISVRRHARLVDYELHEGCNARSYVQIDVGDENLVLNSDNAFFITEHPDNRLKDRVVLTQNDIANLPPNSIQPFEVIRYEDTPFVFSRDDIKNVVGLMAWLVLQNDFLSEILIRSLPSELKQALEQYTSTANDKPPAELIDELTTRLNSTLRQYVTDRHLDAAQFVSQACWEKLKDVAGKTSKDASEHIESLKSWLENFFNSRNDNRIELRSAHNTMYFYTWDQSQCFLPIGSTRATLIDGNEVQRDDSFIYSGFNPFAPTPLDYDRSDSDETLLEAGDPPEEVSMNQGAISPKCSAYALAHLQKWRLKHLSRGDILIFEEVLGAKTHNSADADASHCQAVRLTKVHFCIDPVTRKRLVEIEWEPEDALKFPLCISSVGLPELECEIAGNVSVAHGNVVMVDHGLTIAPLEWLGEIKKPRPIPTCDQTLCQEPLQPEPSRSELFRPVLKESDLTFAVPVKGKLPAASLGSQKPHEALPAIQVFGFPVAVEPADSARDEMTPPPLLVTFDDYLDPARLLDRLNTYSEEDVRRIAAMLPPQAAQYLQELHAKPLRWTDLRNRLTFDEATLPNPVQKTSKAKKLSPGDQSDYDNFRSALQGVLTWNSRTHLLDSNRDDQHFVVEMDNERRARLRFGDNDLGRRPPPLLSFYARYRRGNGVVGNVGAGKIRHLVARGPQGGSFQQIRNPLVAAGGKDFEALDHARLFAPSQFKKQRRAITPDDYAALVKQKFGDKVQNARAQLNWMGTWYEVAVAIDPRPEIRNKKGLVRQILTMLEKNCRIGHRLRVDLPTYVPLQIDITICVKAGYLRAHVQRELLDRFSSGRSVDGQLGLFHPSQFSFGDSLYMSKLISEAKSIRGVENVSVTRFERFGVGSHGELENGVIEFGPLEIARVDNDPLHPEYGRFCLDMRGVR